MSEIISAKCFGCGHVIRVPAALAGKKARCPRCTNTIAIPEPSKLSTTGEFVTDDQLPEVARDEDLLEEDIPSDAPAADPSAETPRRRSSSAWPRVQARPTGVRGARPGYAPPRRGNRAALVAAIALAAAGVVAAVALAAGRAGQARPGHRPPETQTSPTPETPADPSAAQELEARCREYAQAFNRGDITKILEFYHYEPAQEIALKRTITEQLESKFRFDSPLYVKSVRIAGDSGTVTLVATPEMTLHWKKVDGSWKLVPQ
jgi:ribosomal protein S27E